MKVKKNQAKVVFVSFQESYIWYSGTDLDTVIRSLIKKIVWKNSLFTWILFYDKDDMTDLWT